MILVELTWISRTFEKTMDYNEILCVIPARVGSKGIPRKNLQDLAGLPLFVHSVKHALKANIPPSNIIVSSDNDEILSIATKEGVVAHRRPDDISQDLSSTEDCLIEAAKHYPSKKTLLCLQPTSPIRMSGLITDCLQKYFTPTENYDSLHTTTKFYDFFWQEKWHEGQYRWYSSYNPCQRPMRQTISKTELKYFENGNIFISNIEMLKRKRCRIGDNVCVHPISEIEAAQIDTPEDLELMRLVFEGLQNAPL